MVMKAKTSRKARKNTTAIEPKDIVAAKMSKDECLDVGEPEFDDTPPTSPKRRNERMSLPRINTGQPVHEVIQAMDRAIAERTLMGKAELFRQDGRLVIVVRVPAKHGRTKPKISIVSKEALPVYVSDQIIFYKIDDDDSVIELFACPAGIAKAFLEWEGQSAIPILTGIIGAPTLREDFTLVEAQGYDPASGFFLEHDGDFLPVPDAPTKEDALEALERLQHPIKDFPFIDGAAKSSILAAFATSVVRGCLPAAPLFAVTAPTMGTGKSKLTDMCAILATGDYAQPLSYKFEEKEMEKTLFSALLEGATVISIDNIESHLRGSALCTMLTQRTYKSRILGVSETGTVYTLCLFLANGNNLTIRGDLTTRVILCSLDAQVERPQEREFDLEPAEYMIRHRKEMIRDVLTIVLAYRAAVEKVKIRRFGRFEAWSEIVREPLVWLGATDPLDTVEIVERSDPVRQIHAEVLQALIACFGEKPFLAKDCASANSPSLQMGSAAWKQRLELVEVMEAAVASPRGLNGRTVGNWFSQYENRIEGGYKLIRIGNKPKSGEVQRTCQWRVVKHEVPGELSSTIGNSGE